MENKRIALLPADYNKNESVNVNLRNIKAFTKEIENDLLRCKFEKVKDAILIIGKVWGLRPNRSDDFKIIKRVLITSINKN